VPPVAVGIAVAALDGRLELHSPGGGSEAIAGEDPL
jgi:hypothetical protein